MRHHFSVCSILAICLAILSTHTDVLANPARSEMLSSPGLPFLFEENRGQFDPYIDYLARGQGYTIALGQEPVIELFRFDSRPAPGSTGPDQLSQEVPTVIAMARLRLKVLGARKGLVAEPLDRQQKLTHYLLGEKADWRTDVPSFKRVRYSGVLPGIDVEYYGSDGLLEYDFVVHPGADPAAISFEFEGAENVSVNADGDLVIDLGRHEIVQRAPVTYQTDPNGQRIDVPSAYTVTGGTVGVEVAAWDQSKTLVIDPVLEYSRFYGGAGSDLGYAVDLDAAGNIYVISTSSSAGLATPGAFGTVSGERQEAVALVYCEDCTDGSGQVVRAHIASSSSILVTKFSPDGQNVVWSTYFNGTPSQPLSIGLKSFAVSDTGEAAFGLSRPLDGLPLVSSTQAFDGAQNSGYVAKLNSDGNGLVFSTYINLGSAGFALVRGLDVSADGKVAVTGMVGDNNSLPVVTGIPGQSCIMNVGLSEFNDGYVALFDSDGTLAFSSCLGGELNDGSSTEQLRGVAIGDNGDLYVVGYSSMTDFPVVNPVQPAKNVSGAREMTISQIDPDTGSLVFSTWFGPTDPGYAPNGYDYDDPSPASTFFPSDIETDSGGNIIVTGTIGSLSYPAINAFQTNMAVPRTPREFLSAAIYGSERVASVDDFFVTKLHPVDGVVFSTYLGGSRDEDSIPSLAVDADDNVYLAGVTASDDYPVLNAIQPSMPGDYSLVLSKFTPAGALAFSSYLGGSVSYPTNNAGGVAINSSGKIIVGGGTRSDDFPIVGSNTSFAGRIDISLSIIDQSGDIDTDGDGVPDAVDAFPGDDTEWRDTDGNLTGDNADTDDDGDGEPDVTDRFPLDSSETTDADEDGAGDNRDEFDADLANYFDLDDDGLADFDAAELDLDGDGTDNPDDAFDFDALETSDFDGDGIGDLADDDDDGDLTPDVNDPDSSDFDVPVYTFERYSAYNTNLFKSPWPSGFSDVVGADAYWTSAEDQSHSGTTSFSNRLIDHGQAAAIQHSDTYAGGTVQFWFKVDSQENADLLTFSIDANVLLTTSGDSGWQFFETPLTAGAHTLEWRYTKDGSVSEGFDAAWIDDLQFLVDCENVNDVSQAQCEALVALYDSTAGAEWTNNLGWMTDPNVCDWYGITCDIDSNIEQIDLDEQNLVGTIPPDLGDLTNLRILVLSQNQLTGNIPVELGNLNNLVELDLYGNELAGSIPGELGQLASLEILDLDSNQLTGSIPAELGSLSNLQKMILSYNQLTGSIPTELGNLANLTHWRTYRNQLTGSIPAELGNLTNLLVLELKRNQLTGSIPAELGNLTNLQSMALENNQLTGSIPVELSNMTDLGGVWLHTNQLTGSIPVELSSMTNVQTIALHNNQLTGNIPVELSTMTNLFNLDLSNNQLTGSIPAELGNMPNLYALALNSNQLTGAIPDELGNLTDLYLLNLNWNGLYTGNSALDAFLDTQSGVDWSATQTVAPDNVTVVSNGGESVTVSWDPIEFTSGSGRYRVGYSQTPGGPYVDGGATPDKLTTSHFVNGLLPGTTYYFTVTTETDPHGDNQNLVVSDASAESTGVAEFFSEETTFDITADYLMDPDPFTGTPFTELQVNNGYDIVQDALLLTADANLSNADALTLTSENATWNNEQDDGVFLGLSTWDDFIVETTVSSMDDVPGHSVGLMVRVPTTDGLDAAGPGQDYVTLGVTGGAIEISWGSTDNGSTSGGIEPQAAKLEVPDGSVESDIHLRITRNGIVLSFSYRLGVDANWTELAVSPLPRADMDMFELEAGIYQASESEATAVLNDFSIKSEIISQSGFE